MEGRGDRAVASGLSALDRVYLRRACELAARGRGSTSPNPPVGAVIAFGARTLGEGYHRMRGAPHAEREALSDAAERGADVRGATLYVTLEPCAHVGLTPPCAQAVARSGIARVVVGKLDPNPRTARGGVAQLADAGIAVELADDAHAGALIEDFAFSIGRGRPYVRLKLAASLDGFVAARPGVRQWLTGPKSREYVRELRAEHDAVLIGAGTVRVDDPQLTVRPPYARRKPFVRAIACERRAPSPERAIFMQTDDYAPTIVLVPAGRRRAFQALDKVAEVVAVGEPRSKRLDLHSALEALQARGIASILCEGGPTLAARLLEQRLVDRIDWLLAPMLIGGRRALPALPAGKGPTAFAYERVRRLGEDVLLSALLAPAPSGESSSAVSGQIPGGF